MPHKDLQKRKEYHDAYKQSEKGSASLKASKRRYWEKLKADPVRLENWRLQCREAQRLRRLDPETREKINATRRASYVPKPKREKEVKPLDVTFPPKNSKPWMRDRYKPLFVENKNTVRRGRPRKKKFERPKCDHDQGFKFKQTEKGMRRTCNKCGWSFTEVARR